MASQTSGIQALLAAEKRAAEKVSDARKREYNITFVKVLGVTVTRPLLFKHCNQYFR